MSSDHRPFQAEATPPDNQSIDDADWAAIQAGIEDMLAGRMRPLREIDAEIRKTHGWPALDW